MNARRQRRPVDVGVGGDVRRPGAGRSGELRKILGCLHLRRDPLEAPDEHRELLAHRRGRRGLAVGARKHRGIAVRLGEPAQRGDHAAQLGQPDEGDSALDGQCVGRRVDVLARAGEMRELGDRIETQARQPIAHEVLDGLHVVPGDGFLLGEPVDLGLAEVAVQGAEVLLLSLGERGRPEERPIRERDEPLDLDLDAGSVQSCLGEVVGELADGGEVAAVERAQRLRGERCQGTPVGTRPDRRNARPSARRISDDSSRREELPTRDPIIPSGFAAARRAGGPELSPATPRASAAEPPRCRQTRGVLHRVTFQGFRRAVCFT